MATLAEVIELIAKIYDAGEEAIDGQVKGRIQNLQKLGVPLGGNPGKGKRIDYGRSQIYQVLLCLELAELGLLPAQSSALIKFFWHSRHISNGLYAALESEWKNPSEDDLLLVFAFDLMSKTWKQPISSPEAIAAMGEPLEGILQFYPASKFGKALDYLKENGARHWSTVNLSALVRDAERHLAGILPPASAGA